MPPSFTPVFDGNDITWYGKSTYTKPSYVEIISGKHEHIPNGAKLYEMDTQKIFMFDAETQKWLEQ